MQGVGYNLSTFAGLRSLRAGRKRKREGVMLAYSNAEFKKSAHTCLHTHLSAHFYPNAQRKRMKECKVVETSMGYLRENPYSKLRDDGLHRSFCILLANLSRGGEG